VLTDGVCGRLTTVPLHQHWGYLEGCCRLLNNEWPRSITARTHSLQKSNDAGQTSLIMLHLTDDGQARLVGHSMISSIPNYPEACFIQTVIIDKEFRGRGWGRHLMHRTEEYVKKKKGLQVVYLSTKDQQYFYRKLGYEDCEPISIYGNPGNFHNKNRQSNVRVTTPTPGAPKPPPLPPSSVFLNGSKTYFRKFL